MGYRELTSKEKSSIKELVTKTCANYCNHCKECLPLDGACYMVNMHYFRDNLCKYFQNSVLPLNSSLEATLYHSNSNIKRCAVCDGTFLPIGNKATCSEKCSKTAKRIATKERVRKHRQNKR